MIYRTDDAWGSQCGYGRRQPSAMMAAWKITMRKKLLSLHHKRYFFLAPLLIVLAAGVLLTFYLREMSHTALDFTRGYMLELAEHDSLNITDKLNHYRSSLLETADMLRMHKVDTIEEAVNMLKLKRIANRMNNLFLIGSGGMTYSYNNTILDQSGEDYIQEVTEKGHEYLAKPDAAASWYEWNNSLRYAIPIPPLLLNGEEIVGICGEYPFEEIGASLQLKSFDEKGISTLIDRNGNVLSQTGIITQKPVRNNIFDDIENVYKIKGNNNATALIASLRTMQRVDFQYSRDGQDYLCLSIPLPELGLTLISSLPREVASQQYDQLLQLTVLTVLIIAGLILALGIRLYRFYGESLRLENQKNAAEEIAMEKSRFLSNMSHEIRTPLNAIIGFSELLNMSQSLSEQDRDQVGKIKSSSHYLMSLINDILDMSRIDSGKMELYNEPMELDALINSIDSIIGSQAKQKGLRYQVRNNCRELCINGDFTRLQQILINLLGNSLKFTPKDGEIRLDVDCLHEDETSAAIRFVVADTGCGMSEEFLSRLFTPFAQEYNKNTKKQTGTGLGLSICSEMCKLMGGSIQVESTLGEGTLFTVEIPFVKAERIQPKETTGKIPEQADWTGITILIAEDNELNAEILISLLEMHKIKTLWAKNGQEAYELFCASAPGDIALILMDVQMPVMDGLEAADRIRASGHPCAKTIPILAATADAFTSDVEIVLQHGMNGHIAKPIDLEQLFTKLHQCLKESGEKK